MTDTGSRHSNQVCEAGLLSCGMHVFRIDFRRPIPITTKGRYARIHRSAQRSRAMEQQLLGLIAAVYDAAGDSKQWAGMLSRLSEALSGRTTSLILYNTNEQFGNLAVSVGLDPAEQRRYKEYYVGLDPWGVHGGHLLGSGKVLYGEAMCPPRVVTRSEFYTDFLRHLDIFHIIVASVDSKGPQHSVVSITRPESAGAFDSHAHRMLTALMPHFQRALSLQRRFGELQASADWYADVIERLPVGVAMISATGRVLQVNRYAREVLAQTDGLLWDRGEISAHLLSESRRLQFLIRSAALTGEGKGMHPGGSVSIARPSGRRAFKVLVCPYRSAQRWYGVESPAATVFITDPELEQNPSTDWLIGTYGLTAAEATLAVRLMQGESIAQAAARLIVTQNTARTHLKRIFAKTGTSRQSELVREPLLGPARFRDNSPD
jgi:DNA-binding CsgD family transcriptional regulator/PAS domain-containing protein